MRPASQDLRPPGPVPPDIAPFRLSGSADGRPPLCYFSLMDGGDQEGPERGRAFAHPEADLTPCATHVTNWIEDNPRIAWGRKPSFHLLEKHRQSHHSGTIREDAKKCGNVETALDKITRDEGKGIKAMGGESGREGVKDAAAIEIAGQSLPGERVAILRDVVGAGGFAEFIPLLNATIGR